MITMRLCRALKFIRISLSLYLADHRFWSIIPLHTQRQNTSLYWIHDFRFNLILFDVLFTQMLTMHVQTSHTIFAIINYMLLIFHKYFNFTALLWYSQYIILIIMVFIFNDNGVLFSFWHQVSPENVWKKTKGGFVKPFNLAKST